MTQGLWVFGYGSLLWNPGFQPTITRPAVLNGYRRSFCMWSYHHRGTKSKPGLVLALDRSTSDCCHGLALQVAEQDAKSVLVELRRRELISYAYVETKVQLEITGIGIQTALAYVIDRNHHQYCQIGLEKQALVIATAMGGRGRNQDYLEKTVAKLNELGIGDSELDALLQKVRLISQN